MSGLTDSLQGLAMAVVVLMLARALLAIIPPAVRRLALAWARFWAAVAFVVYLNRSWRVAIDRARREIV